MDADRSKPEGTGERVVVEVDRLLRNARARGASDLHLDPDGEGLHVFLRLDGVLHESERLGADLSRPVVARLKFLADLMTWRADIPQEGRLRSPDGDGRGDLRVSTFPTIHGERAVIRFLGGATEPFALDGLNFSADVLAEIRRTLSATSGVILLTGPAGSGKTTTLYSCLGELRRSRAGLSRIITVEDPVEAVIAGVTQTQVNPAAGLTYAVALRSLLRQDPEVLMVGEIRDRETAECVCQAGLTGHLVLSTLHGGDVATVIARLIDMGMEPYAVTSALRAVFAMRLVRKVCDRCRGAGSSCDACAGTGFHGRIPIVEFASISGGLRKVILSSPDSDALTRELASSGMKCLRDRGRDAVSTGLTLQSEIDRVLGPGA